MTGNSNAIQIKVTLLGTEPAIWRRIVIPSAISFFDLHHILQISMGWKNSHLFEFHAGDYRIGYLDEEFEDSDELADALVVQADLLLGKEKATCIYVYDFGDHWEHALEVEAVEPANDRILPVCIDGYLNCPPEDCGGIPGFRDMLKILNDKKHPEYRETKTWVGRGYDAAKLDLDKINKELPKYKKYMRHWKK